MAIRESEAEISRGSLRNSPSGKNSLSISFTYYLLTLTYFTGGWDGKKSTCNAGDMSLIPGLEDPLEEEIITHSSILAWRIPWTEEPGGLQSMWLQRVRHDCGTNTFTFLHTLGLHLGQQVMSIRVGMRRRVMTQNIHLQIQCSPSTCWPLKL